MYRNIMLLSCVLGIGYFLFTPACVYDTLDIEPIPVDTTINCDSGVIYFQKDVLPIVLSSCGMGLCHDSTTRQNGLEYTSYETILATGKIVPFNPMASQFYTQMIQTDLQLVMPPSPRGPISDTNIVVIRKWIEQGALNLDCIGDTICTVPDTVSFSKHVFPVIDKYCKGCHSGAHPWGNQFLRNYAEIKPVALNGVLLGVLNHDDGFSPMPNTTLGKLDSCTIAIITQWINDDAPNN